ncbi:Uncharacterised protein [Tsukamurella paurometabola]|uniref:Uncharacterized protein n=1 Tax=Tsukamurella paurometabola TaxID=2061 RepID=A0A3P8L273_TSUPA|nr:Uncharacterised protein [Tsukamurella paurometabola]
MSRMRQGPVNIPFRPNARAIAFRDMTFLLIVTGVLLLMRLVNELYYRRSEGLPIESA